MRPFSRAETARGVGGGGGCNLLVYRLYVKFCGFLYKVWTEDLATKRKCIINCTLIEMDVNKAFVLHVFIELAVVTVPKQNMMEPPWKL